MKRGESMIEVVVVTFTLVVVLVAIVSLTTVSIARNRLAKERTVATRLAQEGLEWVKYERDRLSFDEVVTIVDGNTINDCILTSFPEVTSDGKGGLLGLNSSSCSEIAYVDETNLGKVYQRRMQLTDNGDGSITVAMTVAWRDTSVQLSSIISRWTQR
jgi:Tfp pilus assembly protein PilV